MECEVVSFKKEKSVTLPSDFPAVDVHRREEKLVGGEGPRVTGGAVSVGEAVILWAGGLWWHTWRAREGTEVRDSGEAGPWGDQNVLGFPIETWG